ncbi:phosphoenolpyruvate--protein phosphotransferase [Vibrio maerlii]|uniref:phosphoenolpyruvate--protein phosphotransferase n=1 Tax=Vibrio maerlii TaxID=2231648 RepID=UPI000E3B670A|nr:phosphoenolpyruvate--protein phosphotransferase [Vibrio maerlii]
MVGIVVVSHSEMLANGVVELANQMTQGRCSIAAAGGIDDPENPIGTDTIRIMMAIEEVYDDSGVLVLMDMGSALLSTETALELLDPDMLDNIALISAPIVEGTMAASVAASADLPLSAVIEEARGCLAAKQEHLGDVQETASTSEVESALSAEALSFSWLVKNPHGLHARPAASIVGALAGFESQIQLERNADKANAKSLNSIAKLAVKCDESITFYVEGSDAAQALQAIEKLAHSHFGESVDAPIVSKETELPQTHVAIVDGAICGIPVCDGIGIGEVMFFDNLMPEIPQRTFTTVEQEKQILKTAIDNTCSALAGQKIEAEKTLGKEHAEIFQAHQLMLSDPDLILVLEQRVEDGSTAEIALKDGLTALADEYRRSDSEYMREREADVWDVLRQTLLSFDGISEKTINFADNTVVVAHDLSPSQTAQLDPTKVVGICLESGGKTSHSAIIARAMGIPAIVKAQGILSNVSEQQTVVVDGGRGQCWLDAQAPQAQALVSEREAWLEKLNAQKAAAHQSATTQSGQTIDVLANIGGLADVKGALESGAEGVGLLRTEFVFQASDALPTEDEQFEIYRDIAAAMQDKPLTIRSLDVGGDKPLPTYPMAVEENPFLGLRGVRLCLSDHALFKPQIKAILRAHQVQPNIQLMIPMIATVEELVESKRLIAECRQELGLEESKLRVGIMIEVPAAVLNAEALAQEADFFSIGTNDLTQYVMAADRGNTAVSELVDYNQPAVLAAIKATCDAAKKYDIPVSMCGEMAGDTKVTQTLIDIGVHKLSASGSLLPALKATIREL